MINPKDFWVRTDDPTNMVYVDDAGCDPDPDPDPPDDDDEDDDDEPYDDSQDHTRCEDCKGTGEYIGLHEVRHCPTCEGAGWI